MLPLGSQHDGRAQNAQVVDNAAKCWITSGMEGQDGVHYYNSITVAAVSNKKKAARFLMQATFGPRYDEIAALEGNDFAGWIAAQMALSIIASSPLSKEIAPAG